MIIQRLAQAIRRQDWFQVVIEVLIVIVGIFLGLQVQGWYEERGERKQEEVFLTRMHTEVVETLGYQDELGSTYVFLDTLTRTDERLKELVIFLNGDSNIQSMNSEHCMSVVTSHILFDPTVTLPTITELLSSGQISIIQSEDIKKGVSEYLRANETLASLVTHLESVQLVMARKYPEMVEFDLTRLGLEFRQGAQHNCDFEAMALSNTFKNDIADNASKFYGYMAGYTVKQEKLVNIHNILDQELGIYHDTNKGS